MSTKPTGTEAGVCEDIARRQQAGMSKYGTTVADNPLELREWLNHAYEECLDQAVYLKRAMDEMGVLPRGIDQDSMRHLAGELIAAIRVNVLRGTFATATVEQVDEWIKPFVARQEVKP